MLKKFNFPLVNTHTHAAMLGFRGLAEDISLDKWLNNFIWPAEKKFVTPNFVYKNTLSTIDEMKENGIAVFCDMYFFEDQVAKAAIKRKMTAVIGEVLLDFPTVSAKNFNEGLRIAEGLINKYINNKYIIPSVAPHSIYTVSREHLIEAKKLARKYGVLFQIHLSETKKEVDDCLAINKCTPVKYLDKLGILDEKTVLFHCVWVNDEDIDIITKRKAKVVHCPMSNLKLGSGIAPVHKMLDKGITVALGTDGAASSNRLDIWEAGKIAALLQKGINFNPTLLPAKIVIEMMTINGLKALEIDNFKGKNIKMWQKKLDREKDFNCLYHLQSHDLDFVL